ncbi:hypothetical protein [Coleofasciculus sp.]|uniref:hypothetical protein n=1 Tax=Coleofasciculus sp. TaxID=3100458 RepID=UPI0039F9BBBF
MSLTELLGVSANISNGILSITLSELNAKAQAFVDSLGNSGSWVGLTPENQQDPEVLGVTFMQAFSNYFTAERLEDVPAADVSCGLSNRTVNPPPFGEEGTGAATLNDEYTLTQSNIPFNFPTPDPNNSFN